MMRGWEGEGGEGGEYDRECLFNDDSNYNEYDNNDEYNNVEDRKGLHGRADDEGNPTTKVGTLSAGCPSEAWGIGC